MSVAEGTRFKVNQGQADTTGNMLQEILRKLKSFDSRLVAIENSSQGRGIRGLNLVDEEVESVDKRIRAQEGSGEQVTTQTTVEFPGFDGSRIQEWLSRSERFFELDETPAELKVSMASVYLSGLAREWHNAFLKNRRMEVSVSWEEYSGAMLMCFGTNELKRPIAQLKRLQEDNSFYDYVDAFVSLVSKVELSDEDQVAMFIEGLKKDNKKLITILNPRTLHQAISYAKTLTSEEDPYQGYAKGQEHSVGSNRGLGWTNVQQKAVSAAQSRGNCPPANKLAAPGRFQNAYGVKAAPYQPPHKRLSNAEVEEKQVKGLCFWCDEKYTFGHKCANMKLYSLVLEAEEAGEGEASGSITSECEEDKCPCPILACSAQGGYYVL